MSRCALCGRRLTHEPPALVIKTRGGQLFYGPVCARRIDVKPTRTAHPVIAVRARPAAVDPAQLALEGMEP